MAIVRYLVDDVDLALPFYRAIGFKLADRWGPPFAVMKGHRLSLWLSGPGTSARKPLAGGEVPVPGGWNRLVVPTKDLDATLARLKSLGIEPRSRPVKGPGGRQVLVADPSGNPVEVFEPREGA